MRESSTVLAALLGICFFRLLDQTLHHVLVWPELLSAIAGALVARAITALVGRFRTDRRRA